MPMTDIGRPPVECQPQFSLRREKIAVRTIEAATLQTVPDMSAPIGAGADRCAGASRRVVRAVHNRIAADDSHFRRKSAPTLAGRLKWTPGRQAEFCDAWATSHRKHQTEHTLHATYSVHGVTDRAPMCRNARNRASRQRIEQLTSMQATRTKSRPGE